MNLSLRFFAGLVLTAVVGSAPSLYAQASGDPNQLTGRWKLEGFSNAFLELVADGGKLTGTVGNPLNMTTISDGVVVGNTVTLKTSSNNNDRTLILAGIIDRDRITFLRKLEVRPGVQAGGPGLYGLGGPLTFVAVRDATKSAPATPPPPAPPPSYPFQGRWKADASDLFFNIVWNGQTMSGSVQDARGSIGMSEVSVSTNTIRFRIRDGEQSSTFVGIGQGDQLTFLRQTEAGAGRTPVTTTLTATRQP